jgi:hypothetical protein
MSYQRRVCESVYPVVIAMQWLSRHVPAAGGVVFYAAHVISKESRPLVFPELHC